MRTLLMRAGVVVIGMVLLAPTLSPAENLGQTDDPGLKVKDCKYGPDTCLGGFVWRGASPADHVCVSPQVRDATRADNQQAAARRNPGGGAYGPDTCKVGFVWRGATPTDHVCVTGQTRAAVQADNAAAASRKACR